MRRFCFRTDLLPPESFKRKRRAKHLVNGITVQKPMDQQIIGNRFFMRWMGESPKKEAYQCPNSSIDIEPRLRGTR
jgi:hypothetical protein